MKTTAEEVMQFLQVYFDLLQEQDMNKFDQVFHKDSVLYSQQDNTFTARPVAEYKEIVRGRKSPAEGKYPRKDEILMVDVLSETTALAKVRLRLFDNLMEDYLNLLKVDGKWVIVSKVYFRAGEFS